MRTELCYAAVAYGMGIVCGAACSATGDGGFGVMGLLFAALGLGFLDLAFKQRECGR